MGRSKWVVLVLWLVLGAACGNGAEGFAADAEPKEGAETTTTTTAPPLPPPHVDHEPLTVEVNELRIEDEVWQIDRLRCEPGLIVGALNRDEEFVGMFGIEEIHPYRFDHQYGLWFPGQQERTAVVFDAIFHLDDGKAILPDWDLTSFEPAAVAARGQYAMVRDEPSIDQFGAVLDEFRSLLSANQLAELFPVDGRVPRAPNQDENDLFTSVYRDVVGTERWAYHVSCP